MSDEGKRPTDEGLPELGESTRLPPWPDELLDKRDLWAAVGFLNGAPVSPYTKARELRRYAAVTGLTPARAHYEALGVAVRPE